MPLPLVVDDRMFIYTLKLVYPPYPVALIVIAGTVRVNVALCFPDEVGL